MNRQALLEVAALCEQAALYATLTASHANVKREDATRWSRETETVLYAALDKLAMAQVAATPADWFALAADITGARAIEAARLDNTKEAA